MATVLADLEDIRRALGIDASVVVGHSWGSDLGLRCAMEYPNAVLALVGLCGHGLHRDLEWSAAYEQAKVLEEPIEIDFVPQVHESLWDSFKVWIHSPRLWRDVAECQVPMSFISAEHDIRPSWPVEQLAELAPYARHRFLPGVIHDFWKTEPAPWRDVVHEECLRARGDRI